MSAIPVNLRPAMMDYFANLMGDIDLPTVGGGSAAAVLAAVWYFMKVIRKIVSVAFSLCLLYVILRIGGVDLSFITDLFTR